MKSIDRVLGIMDKVSSACTALNNKLTAAGVKGVIGVGGKSPSNPVIYVYLENKKDVDRVPKSVNSIKIECVYTGKFVARGAKDNGP